MKATGDAMSRGLSLVLSIWDDNTANMLWLNSDSPLSKDRNLPGVQRGPCPRDSGKPDVVERDHPDANVVYYNIAFGAIGSTLNVAQ